MVARSVLFALVALVALALGGWRPASAVAPPKTTVTLRVVRFIAAPRGQVYNDPVWLSRYRRLVFSVFPRALDFPRSDIYLRSRRLDGSDQTRLRFPKPAACAAADASNPRVVSATTFGYLERCRGVAPENAVRLFTYSYGAGEPLLASTVQLPFSARSIEFGGPGRGWLINDGYGLEEHLDWLRPTLLERLALPFDRVGDPAWARDGHALAVFTSVFNSSSGDTWSLYLLRPDGTPLRQLLSNFSEIWRPTWVLHDRALVFWAQGPKRQSALWFFELATKRLSRLKAGRFGTSAWLSETNTLVVPGTRGKGKGTRDGLFVFKLLT